MNQLVVSNNCIGAYYYTDCLKVPMQTVFSYSRLPTAQLGFLMDNLYDIDFGNVWFNVIKSSPELKLKNYIHARIGGRMDVHYVHYFKPELKKRKLQYAVHLERMKSLMAGPHELIFAFFFDCAGGKSPHFQTVGENDYDLIQSLLSRDNVYAYTTDPQLVDRFPTMTLMPVRPDTVRLCAIKLKEQLDAR